MNEEMRKLSRMLSEPLDKLQPKQVLTQIQKVRNSYNEKTHTFVNANIIADQIESLWEKGCLNSELLVFLCTNIIYDSKVVIDLRRHVATFARNNNPCIYKKL